MKKLANFLLFLASKTTLGFLLFCVFVIVISIYGLTHDGYQDRQSAHFGVFVGLLFTLFVFLIIKKYGDKA